MSFLLLSLGTAVWALAEATFFFIPADAIVAAGAALHPHRWWVFPLEATAGALAGGVVTWAAAVHRPGIVRTLITRLPGHSPAFTEQVLAEFRERGWRALVAAGFLGRPYKLYALGAAEDGRGILPFLSVSVLARLPRFALGGVLAAGISRATGRGAIVAAGAVAVTFALTAVAMAKSARSKEEPRAERL